MSNKQPFLFLAIMSTFKATIRNTSLHLLFEARLAASSRTLEFSG